jgi:RES domain-containing protein
VIFHKVVALAEIDCFEDQVTYDDYAADFHAEFPDLRNDRDYDGCLRPDSYVEAQALAADLLEKGAAGIVYPSVRDPDGTNLACFRPALVGNVRLGSTWRFTWAGDPAPSVALETAR